MRLPCAMLAVVGASLLLAPPLPRCAACSDEQALLDPTRFDVETIPEEASVHGKYRTLLRRIHCPEDLPAYHRFTDYGMYTGTSWHNHTNLPPGYWVYVYPDWYIWRDGPAAQQGAPPAAPAAPSKPGK